MTYEAGPGICDDKCMVDEQLLLCQVTGHTHGWFCHGSKVISHAEFIKDTKFTPKY